MATMAEHESIERGYQRLSSIFRPVALDSNKCHRCKLPVYHAEKMGPVLEVIYHKHCFRCVECGQHLTMKNYCVSQVSGKDREVYCNNHYPRVGAAHINQSAVGIRGAVSAQENFRKMSRKLNSEIRKPGTIRIPSYDANAVAIKRILTSTKAQEYTTAVNKEAQKGISIGPDAMGIKQPIAAQKLQTAAHPAASQHNYQPRVSHWLPVRFSDNPTASTTWKYQSQQNLISLKVA